LPNLLLESIANLSIQKMEFFLQVKLLTHARCLIGLNRLSEII
jgi:hypothetical protein